MRSVGIAVALVWCAGLAHAAPTTKTKSQVTKSTTTAKTKSQVTKSTTTARTKSQVTKSKKSSKQAKKKLPAKRKRWNRAVSPKSRFAVPDDVASSPAVRYASMSVRECEAELVARKIPFTREAWNGVRSGVRLGGPLHGVEFRTNLKDRQRATTPWEVADCRLVLALDDFAEILAAHDIVDVRHYSMHRLVPKSWPDGKKATRHMAGVAIDAARFIARDGSYLDVDKHFNGAIGSPTCGDKAAPRPATPEALKLRAILCEAVSRRLFNVVLTPNYNRPHKNHFHLEVTEGVKWFLVH
jgi:hypothetical protein